METRLKERLTGAAILVALIVLLVPEMFHGQRGDVAATAGSSGEGPPVRSYTIDLSNGPTRTAPLQSTPATNQASANGGPASAADSSSEPAPPAPAATSATPAPPATPTPSAPSAAATVTAPATASAVTPKLAQTASAAHASAGGWSVQLGLFAQRDNADRLAHSAQNKGLAVNVSDRDAKGLYHVHMAGLADRAAAQALLQRLRDQGFAGTVVAPPPGAGKIQP
jgi:DedD protein